MRKGLTLIELILSMVIIGIVFTVIPRLVMSMNQSSQVTLKEEAMYNAMAQMGMILNLPWDNNNTQNPQILSVTAGDPAYDCNTTSGYRIGGFVGGRNCIGSDVYSAGSIGQETDNLYNDIDDYDKNITTTKSCTNLYDLNTTVKYVNENDYTPVGSDTTHAKMIGVKVKYAIGNKLAGTANCIADLNYTSYNIGHIQINSRNWN